MAHAHEFLPYLLTIIGFFAVYVLNGIKGEIKEVKTTMKSLESDLRGGVTSLERRQSDLAERVSVIEARCSFHRHAQD